ncbi:MAG TPA: hypothetical protein VMT27_06760 [Actinomycetes bacterium]|nr:hypothetical protein [Actinomycetes bacterium]
MSKERARRRAAERASRHAPHHPTSHPPQPPAGAKKKSPQRSARAERQRRRVLIIGVGWVLANAAIWIFTSTWNARWLGLTLTTIAVPLIVWFAWDPEGRTNL